MPETAGNRRRHIVKNVTFEMDLPRGITQADAQERAGSHRHLSWWHVH